MKAGVRYILHLYSNSGEHFVKAGEVSGRYMKSGVTIFCIDSVKYIYLECVGSEKGGI